MSRPWCSLAQSSFGQSLSSRGRRWASPVLSPLRPWLWAGGNTGQVEPTSPGLRPLQIQGRAEEESAGHTQAHPAFIWSWVGCTWSGGSGCWPEPHARLPGDSLSSRDKSGRREACIWWALPPSAFSKQRWPPAGHHGLPFGRQLLPSGDFSSQLRAPGCQGAGEKGHFPNSISQALVCERERG